MRKVKRNARLTIIKIYKKKEEDGVTIKTKEEEIRDFLSDRFFKFNYYKIKGFNVDINLAYGILLTNVENFCRQE